MEKIHLSASDGYSLNIHIFEVTNPLGFVQVIHGMEEHQERYEPFVKKLNEIGFTVITSNMRGHGEDAPVLGYFAPKKGYKLLIEDQKIITKYIKERFNVEKIILFAHSMGTIISRNLLMTESNDYSKVILSGYPNPNPGARIGLIPTSIVKRIHGPAYFSKTLEDIAIGSFNNAVSDPKTDLDWLSFNEENVQKYIDDPYCGHGFKVSALKDLFTLVKLMSSASNYGDVNKSLPLLMLRGDSDPCTGYDNGSKKSISILKKAGFTNIKEVKYEHMRHEILNEDLDKVFSDIKSFLVSN